MEAIQILIILFALFALSRVVLRLKQGQISLKEFIFWAFIWSAVIVVAIIPRIVGVASLSLGIGRGVDFLIYISIILLFYLMFRMYVKIDALNHDMSRLVTEIAIERKKKK